MSARTTDTSRRRLPDREIRLGVVTGLVLVALAVVAALSTNGLPFVPSYELSATLPAGTPSVRVGTEVRSAGRHVGVVTSTSRAGRLQKVHFRLDVHPAGRDATVTLRVKSAAGGRVLDVALGDPSRGELPDGGEVDPRRVRYTEDFPTIVSDFSARALRESQRTIKFTGYGLLGRGGDLNQAVDDLPATLDRTTRLLQAMTPGDDLPALTRSAADVVEGLEGRRPGEAADFVTSTANLLDAFRDPRSRLGPTLDALPPAERAANEVLPEADVVLRRTTALSRRLRPAVAALRDALPATQRLLETGPILQRTSTELAAAALPALRSAEPVLRRLGPSTMLLADLMPPVATLTGYLARFSEETTTAAAAFFTGAHYEAPHGEAKGTPAVPAMLIVTCARGIGEIDVQPGQYVRERMERPCR